MPSLLEYLSYNCNFMGILAGPTCSYNDYKAFIEGTSFQPRHQENANGKENGKCKQSEPSPRVGLSFFVFLKPRLAIRIHLVPFRKARHLEN